MTATYAALITAIAGVVLAAFTYLLGVRRAQWDRLHERLAEVLAELSRLLWLFQRTALNATQPNQPPEVRAQRLIENRQALTALQHHYFGHTAWLPAEVSDAFESFIQDMVNTLRAYEHDLNEQGQPRTDVGIRASKHIFDTVPLYRHN